ncbi:hypothetical protein BV20DRAFT_1111061 [Pilatotrama ljubarskyi]|nr:hypothetical protein BV20DRAFT_1111061 [Pilatotrama ljubarskyi]
MYPIELHEVGPNDVCGVRLDGQKIKAESMHDTAFRSSIRQFSTLAMFPAFEDVPPMRRLLDGPLPLLEHLSLDVELIDLEKMEPLEPPVITLCGRNLPALQTLIAHHCFVRLDVPLVRNLRRLHLKHEHDMDHIERLPISSFLEMLRNCVNLEELYVGSYLDVGALSNSGPLPVVSLAHLNNLKLVKFLDEPRIISKILSCLHIPARIGVIAISYATTIRVNDSEGYTTVLTLEKNEVSFDMELRVAHPDFKSERDSGSVSTNMVRYATRFRGAPIKTFHFAGNVLAVPDDVWATTIDAFPDVREISVEDEPNMSFDSLSAFLETLLRRTSSTSPAVRGRIICPNLSCFIFRGAFHEDEQLPERIYRCFKQRVQDDAWPLDKLHLQLFPDRVWTPNEVARFRQVLASVARTVVLEMHDDA